MTRHLWTLVPWFLSFAGEVAAQAPAPPGWFPLPADQQKHLEVVLRNWESRTGQIQSFRCTFTRWDYDPVILPRNPEVATSIARGNIKFDAADKGSFRTENQWQIILERSRNMPVPRIKDGKPEYADQYQLPGEHWTWDGKSAFYSDPLTKQMINADALIHPGPVVTQMFKIDYFLPPQIITEGPLPLLSTVLFEATSQAITDRYWIRVVTPPPTPGHFWLEAVPKKREEPG